MAINGTSDESVVLLIDRDDGPKDRRERLRSSIIRSSSATVSAYKTGESVKTEVWDRATAVVGHLADIKGNIPSHFTGRVSCYSGANLP